MSSLNFPRVTWLLLTAMASLATSSMEGILQSRLQARIADMAVKDQVKNHLGVEQDISFCDQKLDHFNPLDNRTFSQRYFEFLDYWRSPDGPVFLLVCGEYVCGGVGDDYRLVLAQHFGAALVTLEHRYYGESQPFEELSTENLAYLSSKQAVFDLATFRNFYQENINRRFNRSVTGVDNPWIVIGVSYPGALSAWFRLKFPHLTRGSLASSAVVEAVLDYSAFDQQVAASAGPECAAALREVNAIVEEEMRRNKTAIKALFNAESLEVDGDFLFLLADAAAFAFQYGSPDVLCLPLVGSTKGGDVLTAYVEYVQSFFYGHFGGLASDYDQSALLDVSSKGPNAVSRAWWFQCCSEVAYFQTAPLNDSIRSTKVNLKYYQDLCANVFGKGLVTDTSTTNLFYGGRRIRGSRIFFVNGSQDPWRHASKQTSSPGEPSRVITCHNCGHGSEYRGCPQWPPRPSGDPSHCSKPAEVNKVRHEIMNYVEAWIQDEDLPQPFIGHIATV